jgi:hypothetical protein
MPLVPLERHRRLVSVLLAVSCLVAIAGCGSSSSHHDSGVRPGRQGLRFASCMRSHGVPNFPDPSAGGGFDIASTINARSPAYIAARQMCTNLLPGPIAPHTLSDRDRVQLVAATKCMRTHGINLADPTFNGPYITLDVPDQTTMHSPAFKPAEQACHYPVPKNSAQ